MLQRHVRCQIRGSWTCQTHLDYCQRSIMHECPKYGYGSNDLLLNSGNLWTFVCMWYTCDKHTLCSFIRLHFRGGTLNAPPYPTSLPPYRTFQFMIPTDTGLRLYLFQITVYFRNSFVDDDDYDDDDDDDYDDEMMLLKVEMDQKDGNWCIIHEIDYISTMSLTDWLTDLLTYLLMKQNPKMLLHLKTSNYLSLNNLLFASILK